MSDSGRVIVDCKHGRDPRWCYTCLHAEIKRLKAGKFTEEEFQNLCHNFDEKDRERFVKGCEDYQRKLFGGCQSGRRTEDAAGAGGRD